MTQADGQVSADSAVGQAEAREVVLAGLVASLQRGVEQSAARAPSGEILGLDLVVSVAQGLEGERGVQGARLCQSTDVSLLAVSLLTVADVVTVAAARAMAVLERSASAQQREDLPALVDLWIRAEAVRSLWVEVYCRADGAGCEVLRGSVRQLAADALALTARLSELAPVFAQLVARVLKSSEGG
jgi:hypothetical protein